MSPEAAAEPEENRGRTVGRQGRIGMKKAVSIQVSAGRKPRQWAPETSRAGKTAPYRDSVPGKRPGRFSQRSPGARHIPQRSCGDETAPRQPQRVVYLWALICHTDCSLELKVRGLRPPWALGPTSAAGAPASGSGVGSTAFCDCSSSRQRASGEGGNPGRGARHKALPVAEMRPE